MTTDPTPLQERIARALYENAEYYGPAPTRPPWDWRDDEERGEWMEIAAAVLPIVAVEVRKAKAEAWGEGYLDRSPYGGRAIPRRQPLRGDPVTEQSIGPSELAVQIADEWLDAHRKGDTWRIVDSLRDEVVRLADALAAVEHRATRAEAQSAIRGRAVVMYRERARDAEARIRDLTQEVKDERGAALDLIEQVKIRDARIKAVQDALSFADMGETLVTRSRIRRALDGEG